MNVISSRLGEHPVPLRAAIVGFGVSGRVFHAPFLAASDAYSLDAVVTSDAQRASEARRLHPGAAVVPNFDELLRRAGDLDLVVLSSPPSTHASLGLAALEAGCDVVVDKPFAVSSAEGRALIDAADKFGRLLTVFQNRRWDGDYLTVRELIGNGAIGRVHRFESRFEWYKPDPRVSWKTDTTVVGGGGILYDLGTHVIDQALQLFGDVTEVYAELCTRRPDAVAEDDAFVALQHCSGTISHLWMNSVAPQFGPRFHILGSAGAYTTYGLDGQEAALGAGMSPDHVDFGVTTPERWGVVGRADDLVRHPTARGDYGEFYRSLAEAIRHGGPAPVDPSEAVAVLQLIERIHAEFA